ncbi:hypothetical protein SNE40_011993 [Patella caerulea]|uniref:Ribosomal protein L7Ae/L30e/S12e/Gadd45 domain-containing protein n=1 Tax=Patella caerulea TaxID=87958 RepID=A0AAN8JQL0_PATCE
MTLEEIDEAISIMQSQEKTYVNIGRMTKEIIWQSLEQGRLWCGGYELGSFLKSNPDDIMFCVLPDVKNGDVTASIEHTLIQAICWENNVRILKVDDKEKLSQLLVGRQKKKKNKNENLETVSCVLLEYPSKTFSSEEKEVCEFYKWNQKFGQSSKHIIQLPV